MAINIGQAMVRLAADSKGLMGELDQAGNQTKGWASGLGGSVKTLMTGAIIGGATAIGAALVGIGATAFDVAMDTDTANKQMQSQFGLTAAEAERMALLAQKAWGDNWGESIGDVGQALGLVDQQLRDLGVTSDQALTDAATHAIGLRDAYEVDVGESVSAAKTLMENFGLSSQEAFDFIASGMQQGLDRSGDFIDTIGEYSTQFANGGADAAQFFSILDTGLQGGMLGTDKAADLFKEFRVRIQDGSETTRQGLEDMGFAVDDFLAKLSSGEMTEIEAFEMINQALAETEDQALLMQAGVALMGTQFEDLGQSAVAGITSATTSMGDLAGATDSLGAQYTSLPQVFEASKRKVIVALAPIGNVLLRLANQIIPSISEAFDGVMAIVGPMLEELGLWIEKTAALIAEGGWSALFTTFEDGSSILSALFEVFGMGEESANGLAASINEVVAGVSAFLAPIVEAVTNFVSWKDILIVVAGVLLSVLLPAIGSIVISMAPILLVIAAVIGIVALLRNAWENNWGGIQEKVQAVLGFIAPFIQQTIASIKAWWDQNGEALLAKANEIWEGIKSAISTVINAVSEIITAVTTAIKEAWDRHGEDILAAATNFWEAIRGAIESAINTVKDIIERVANAIKAFWESHGEAIIDGAQAAWDNIKEIIDNSMAAIKTLFDTFAALFNGDWEGFLSGIGELWSTSWENMILFIEGLWDLLSPILSGLWTEIQGFFDGIVSGLVTIGDNIIQGIITGINNAKTRLRNMLSGVASVIPGWLKSFLGIGSPAKALIPIGEAIAEGMAAGIASAQPSVENASIGLAKAAVSAPGGSALASTRTEYHYHLQANYAYQDRESLADDVRMLAMLRGA